MRFSMRLISAVLALVMLGSAVAPAYAGEKASSDTVQVQIQNKTGSDVTLTLTGPATYYLHLKTGKNKADVLPGNYSYSYQACGKTNTGKFNVKKNGGNLTLPKCANSSGKVAGEVKVTIKNYTGGSITIYLTGPQSYVFNFASGTSKMYVTAGTYNYTVYGCGTSITGTKKFKGGGLTWSFWCY